MSRTDKKAMAGTGQEEQGAPSGREEQGAPAEKQRWLDHPRNVNKIFWGLVVMVICALTVLADLLYHKHVHYGIESIMGYHGLYGFVSCVVLVLAAKVLRRVIKRDEDYYD